ncbi:MAG: hypothetical protein A2268_08465 [Candidatus Raymondbacteria bacterium RifOxyA12_full_50_37]|uniref:MotA/TolQ/ExbB proton channel domain-containing protein n=1 Tax=Candidatus Raymondbacteria bacterium RIFOXYD12_FULL_49_13 TaxID=1817890 RepID=A0A1F7F3S7_UNCRA|nr:MAG: hypothetical protein A2268_08465 [Candidatus Raymondbacteria bacterium RifOxyA12_full_50_37]OGJ90366.1 MAG: hypothetical protein A2248_17400 [Candidatus Raymondbacteria bacterium RIFOXYA2_FULL_49_16]OGK01299.1 MAG: hypothetical protein A2519_12915 [Candidatus Raymondbacteria bacterium RIFOXYD12_FULL_49_13]OGP43265.1 MAG: hypothetical protein A2324_08230 [Candidatus Raymondbacteria bacterium RIFOXYB2_FULL_49_35]
MLQAIARFFVEGGGFMWIILSVLAAAVAVSVERVLFFYSTCKNNARQTTADFIRALNAGDAAAAEKVCAGAAPLNRILAESAKLYTMGLSYKDIKQGLEEVAIGELQRFSDRVSYISLFANISTLLGLMGTIFGLIMAFSSLSGAEAAQKAEILARGISVAMNTTAFGLIVAVPCMIAFTVFQNRQAALMAALDESIVKVLHFMEKKRP